jgi:SAM-dependent methyltransferase
MSDVNLVGLNSPRLLAPSGRPSENDIEAFWQANPCGEEIAGGLSRDYLEFFDRYDAYRYRAEGHILRCLDGIALRGMRVLEIGLGQGADSEQLIRRGAIWSGLDLTAEACKRTELRLKLKGLPYERVVKGSALAIDFPDDTFDLVFSHGVLHHIPDIRAASREIARVLRPGGELVAMLYARHSLNYWLSICAVRRLGLIGMYATGLAPAKPIYRRHLELARKVGLWRYLGMDNFIHRSTDGPDNPYSKVYDLRRVREDFPDFTVSRAYKRMMHAPPLPAGRLPLARWLGWHLWVHLMPRRLG